MAHDDVQNEADRWNNQHAGLKWVARKTILPDGRENWDAILVPVDTPEPSKGEK